MKKVVSLKDIAIKANLSETTVSRALNDQKDVSEETRQRVKKVAEELHYRPNLLAQSMHTGATRIVGVIAPDLAPYNEFMVQVIIGIHNELAHQDYVPINLWASSVPSPDSDHHIIKQIHQLIDRRVDGIILYPTQDASISFIEEVKERHIPLAVVDLELEGLNVDFVGTDDFYGASLATQYLIKLGHRRITHFGGCMTGSTARQRCRGFEDAASRAGIEYRIVEDPVYGADLKINQELAYRILADDSRPTAVFCASDQIATGIYKAAQHFNIHIPRDLSVVGYADMSIAQLLDPPLTTVRQNPYELGAHASRLLIQRSKYQQAEMEPQKILLKPDLAFRDSAARFE